MAKPRKRAVRKPKPDLGRLVQVRMPTALYGQISKAATEYGTIELSVSQWIRMACRQALREPVGGIPAHETVKVSSVTEKTPFAGIEAEVGRRVGICHLCGKVAPAHAPACPSRPPLIRSEAD